MSHDDDRFMARAIELSRRALDEPGLRPFGAVVVKDGRVVGEGVNAQNGKHDPTSHGEVEAIRAACAALATTDLAGCTLYTSCEPCPMCLGAIFWARPSRLVYACTRTDAAAIDFDDARLYEQLQRPPSEWRIPSSQTLREEALLAFEEYRRIPDKIHY